MQPQMQQLLEALKKQGLTDISIAHLEASRQLLIKFECEVTIQAIARLTVLKYQHPNFSDSDLIDSHVKLQQERAASASSYGSQLAQNTRDDIWESLEQSGIIDEIAQDLQFRLGDAVIAAMVAPKNQERQSKRQNALQKIAQKINFLSCKQDEAIDVDYQESTDDLDTIIGQALAASNPNQLQLTGDVFRGDFRSLPATTEGGNGAKKLQSAVNGNGKG
ncbi:hypothetical protein PN499_26590 [Kamptonema animale CS-326]|uniref:hypothetical protein n=1 Tax=Kamptonema animale TaxID=92934 RepID=UPI002330900F|nr:hypothetical protein [Kamptonema animale]MDB9514776.1 hypothetical protein [Kamptonema animale CS-326]